MFQTGTGSFWFQKGLQVASCNWWFAPNMASAATGRAGAECLAEKTVLILIRLLCFCRMFAQWISLRSSITAFFSQKAKPQEVPQEVPQEEAVDQDAAPPGLESCIMEIPWNTFQVVLPAHRTMFCWPKPQTDSEGGSWRVSNGFEWVLLTPTTSPLAVVYSKCQRSNHSSTKASSLRKGGRAWP